MDGRLSAGSRLPSELQLANKLKVSRTTIRLALSDLAGQEIIQSDRRRWIVRENVKPSRGFLSDAVALIMEPPDQAEYSNHIHHTWHIDFVHTGAVAAIRNAGFDAYTIHPDRVAGDMIQRIIAQRPRGVIVLSRVLQQESGQRIGKALHEGNVPFVIYGDLGLAAGVSALQGVDSVVSDHEAGAYALTQWLIKQGRRRILRFWQLHMRGPQEKELWLLQRDRGYERAMKDAGLEPLPALEVYDPGYHNFGNTKENFEFRARIMAGYLIEHLLGNEPVDAIIAPSDGMIGHLSAALRVHGRKVNDDVLLAGYDNMWDDLEVREWEPLGPVATVDKRNLEIGANLLDLLAERIEGKLFAKGERRVVMPELVVRPSAFPRDAASAPMTFPIAKLPRDVSKRKTS